MWIRTQDKIQLINSDNIYVIDEIIYGSRAGNRLGSYATHERALEVLDDIETSIQSLIHIYHMPED